MPAYNNYTPMYQPYYNPYQYQQPMVQQPQMVQQQQPTQTMPNFQSSNPNMIWVKNRDAAMIFPVAPNNAVALWDENDAAVYLKQADASGKPTMKTYDLVERVETPPDEQKSETSKDVPYAMKEDVAALAGVVKGFDSMIASMKGDIDKMNETLYGISGAKRKSTKKSESEDET